MMREEIKMGERNKKKKSLWKKEIWTSYVVEGEGEKAIWNCVKQFGRQGDWIGAIDEKKATHQKS